MKREGGQAPKDTDPSADASPPSNNTDANKVAVGGDGVHEPDTLAGAVEGIFASFGDVASVLSSDDLGAYAVDLAVAGWEVFPCSGKLPAIPSPHPKGTDCRGECGLDGHGHLDATTDLDWIVARWREYPNANIGARVPQGRVVLDVDPRHGGHLTLATLEREHGKLPKTLSAYSGRGDGGRHLHWVAPVGDLTASRLGDGLDLKTRSGYVVMPPSIHPDSGKTYAWDEPASLIRAMPAWLVDLVTVAPRRPSPTFARPTSKGLDALVEYVSRLEVGNRNNGLHWACCRAVKEFTGAELDAALDALVAAAVQVGLDRREAERTAASARRTP